MKIVLSVGIYMLTLLINVGKIILPGEQAFEDSASFDLLPGELALGMLDE